MRVIWNLQIKKVALTDVSTTGVVSFHVVQEQRVLAQACTAGKVGPSWQHLPPTQELAMGLVAYGP